MLRFLSLLWRHPNQVSVFNFLGFTLSRVSSGAIKASSVQAGGWSTASACSTTERQHQSQWFDWAHTIPPPVVGSAYSRFQCAWRRKQYSQLPSCQSQGLVWEFCPAKTGKNL